MSRDLTKRAKEADRAAAIDLLQAAYADGQLAPVEFDSRVSRAQVAVTLGDLSGLTGDLQEIPAPAEPPTRSRRALVVGGLVALLLLAGAGYTVLVDEPEPAPATTPSRPAPAVPEIVEPEPPGDDVGTEPKREPQAPRYSFTPRGVRNFSTLHRREFGRPPSALAFGFTDHQVVIYRPSTVPGTINRWFLRDGRFLDDGPETPAAPLEPGLIDLRDVDIDAMFRHVRTARASAADPVDVLGVSILRTDRRPEVVVSAGNRSTGLCYRITATLSGKVLSQGTEACA